MDYPQTVDEVDLLNRVSKGDEQAFTIMYDRYRKRVTWYIGIITKLAGSDPHDLCQEVFLRLWEKRVQLSAISCFEVYVFKVSRNIIFNEQRRAYHRDIRLGPYMSHVRTHHNDTSEMIDYRFMYQPALDVLKVLPARCLEVYLLYAIQGYSRAEIARHFNISQKGVNRHILRATEILAANLARGRLLMTWIILMVLLQS